MDSAGFTYFGRGRLVCKSSASADNGKTISVTNGTKSYSGTLTDGSVSFDLPAKNKYHIKLLNGSTTEFETDIVFNFSEYKEIEVGINKTTWRGIQNILNAHLETSMLTIGDEITETLTTGEKVVFQLAAINHDSNQTHQSIWLSRYCLETTRQMNATNVNAGGWNSSAMRSWLNGTFYSELSDELKAVIAERTVQTSIGSQSTTLQNATDKIWLPREKEIFGSTTYAVATEAATANQFDIFATAAQRVKTLGSAGSAASWWESSPDVSNSTVFCFATSSGTASGNNASSAYGVVPCFHIIAAA